MADGRTVRKSGLTQAEEVSRDQFDEAEKGLEENPGQESPLSLFRTPGFSRMRFTWNGPDEQIVRTAQKAVNDRIQATFTDAYQIMHDLFIIVRVAEHDPDTGEIKRDAYGWPEWKRTPSGGWEEDWSALSRQAKEDFLFQITTRLFSWELRSADAWGEAMFAKAQWEERFAIDYDAPATGTIEDRTARAKIGAAEERYFAIFLTLYSRKAEGIVRVMSLLAQRLKDTLET